MESVHDVRCSNDTLTIILSPGYPANDVVIALTSFRVFDCAVVVGFTGKNLPVWDRRMLVRRLLRVEYYGPSISGAL